VKIGTKTNLKTKSFAVFKNFRFVITERQGSGRTLLYQSVYQAPCSVFRHSWISLQGTWTSPPAVLPLLHFANRLCLIYIGYSSQQFADFLSRQSFFSFLFFINKQLKRNTRFRFACSWASNMWRSNWGSDWSQLIVLSAP